MVRFGSQKRSICAWAIVALAAILFRALIPVGYMTVVDSRSGAIEVTMCTGAGGLEAVSLEATGDIPTPNPIDSDCPFAMSVALVLPEANSLATAPAVYAFEYALASKPAAALVAAWSPHAPPTGPPLTA